VVSQRILLVGGKERLPTNLPVPLGQDSDHPFQVETTRIIQDALLKISETGYDAVVCWAEQKDELSAVVRIRHANPQLPILVLTSQKSPEFQALAREAGATSLEPHRQHLEVIAEHISLAVQSGELHQAIREQIQQALAHVSDLRRLRDARNRVRSRLARSFVPLLVEDDRTQAMLMLRAFDKADIAAPLPVLETGDEAVAYLSGAPPYQDRGRFPLPSVVILDGHLPGKSGHEVLQWIRLQVDLRRLPVVMLSSSSDPDLINRAYQLGVNSYLVKPTSFQALVEFVSRIESQFGATSGAPPNP